MRYLQCDTKAYAEVNSCIVTGLLRVPVVLVKAGGLSAATLAVRLVAVVKAFSGHICTVRTL